MIFTQSHPCGAAGDSPWTAELPVTVLDAELPVMVLDAELPVIPLDSGAAGDGPRYRAAGDFPWTAGLPVIPPGRQSCR